MLKFFLILLISIVFIALILYMMPIKVKLKTIRVKDDDIISIRVKTLYGIVNLKFEVPFLDIEFVNNKLRLKYKAKVESGKTNKLLKKLSKVFTADDFNNMKRFFHHDPVFFEKMKSYWSKRLIINDFSLIFKYGTKDAAFTALIYGALWAIVGSALAILNNNLKFSTKDIVITPYFDRETFNIEFSCIIKFKFGDIINIGIMLIKRRIQLKIIEHELKDTLNAS